MQLGNKVYFSFILFFLLQNFSFSEEKITSTPLINLNEIKPSFEELNEDTENFVNNKNRAIKVPSLGDHRICMSSTVLSLVTGVKAKIKNFDTVRTSSPNFLKTIKLLGGNFEIQK